MTAPTDGTTVAATFVCRTVGRIDDRLVLCKLAEEDAVSVTVKLELPPESVNPEVDASIVEREETMSIEVSCQVELSIAPVFPSIVAVALVIVTEPKSASGKTPDDDEGASTTHSADDLAAEEELGLLFATPLLVVGLLAVAFQNVRSALMSIPMHVLIGLNAMRVLGVLFLLLAAVGRLSGPFPFSAGFGDIITGALAVPLVLMAARSTAPFAATTIWNLFGTLDLFAAVGLGITSAAGSPLQLIHAGVGSEAMQLLPFCLVPTVLVPFYLITHAIIAAQLATHRATSAIVGA